MAGRVHCSSVTCEELTTNYKESFSLEERGLVEMKGKGKLTTYWLRGTEANNSLNKDALAKLDAEVKDLLTKADFNINIDSMEKGEAALCGDEKTPSLPMQPPKPTREFRLPTRTSIVRCSVPSMHDVRRIGSIMRKIKNGGDAPAKNFSWTNKKRLSPRKVKSMGDYEPPTKRNISKLSDNSAASIAERLAPLELPQKYRRLNCPSDTSSDVAAIVSVKSEQNTRTSPLGFKAKIGPDHASGLQKPKLSDSSLKALATRMPASMAPGRISASSQGEELASLRNAKEGMGVCLEALQRARRVSSQASDGPVD